MSLLDRSLQTHSQSLRLSLRLSLPLQRDRSHPQDPVVQQSRWTHNPRKVGVTSHQYCGSCSRRPFLDFDTAGSECTNKRMNKQQARPCMCASTKQTKRFCTRHRGKTSIACSLEPCMKMHATITFPLDRDKGKEHRRRTRRMRLSTDVCQLADSTPSSECFPLDVEI